MKVMRLAVLGVALAAGGLAALTAVRMRPAPAPPVVVERTEAVPAAEILVAGGDLPSGNVLNGSELARQKWPKAALNPQFITRETRPNAAEQLKGSIVRTAFVSGEPIKEQKLVTAGKGGVMSAILTPGMRAISTEISAETGAGGFILPRDKVDVILTRRDQGKGGQTFQSETILRGVQVLAIDQALGEKNGERTVIGRTATLEVTPRQAEILALARQLGTLQLALRALTDQELAGAEAAEGRAVTLVRYGIVSQTR